MKKDYLILPRVKKSAIKEGEFRFKSLKISAVGNADIFFSFCSVILPEIQVISCSREEANVVLSVCKTYSSMEEYCSLKISHEKIEILCRDEMGVRNAAAVLSRIIKKADNGLYISCGYIEDWPDTSYRAMMLESSGRVWVEMDALKRYAAHMAICRMNVLQFHFWEEPGCTIALESAAKLRGFGEDNKKFTKAEIADFIEYCGKLGISVVPFIEILTHANCLSEDMGMACNVRNGKPLRTWDICVGREENYRIIDDIIAEISELFPDEVIHIGADEMDMSIIGEGGADSGGSANQPSWSDCEDCKKIIKQNGYNDEREMYIYALEKINEIINSHGKIMMVWNAELEPFVNTESLSRNILVHYYRHRNDLGKNNIYDLYMDDYLSDGFSVINSFYPETYIDFEDYCTASKINDWSPVLRPKVSKNNLAKLTGACCCAWENHSHYKRTVVPAIVLFADRYWNADTSVVPYDNWYGSAMTKTIFGYELPDNINIFLFLGDVLPPRRDDLEYYTADYLFSRQQLEMAMDGLEKYSKNDGFFATTANDFYIVLKKILLNMF